MPFVPIGDSGTGEERGICVMEVPNKIRLNWSAISNGRDSKLREFEYWKCPLK